MALPFFDTGFAVQAAMGCKLRMVKINLASQAANQEFLQERTPFAQGLEFMQSRCCDYLFYKVGESMASLHWIRLDVAPMDK